MQDVTPYLTHYSCDILDGSDKGGGEWGGMTDGGSSPDALLGGDKAPANVQLITTESTDCCLENTCCFIGM